MNQRTRPVWARLATGTVVLTWAIWTVGGSSAAAQSCVGGVENDFNGDGVADIAIADPDATVGGHERAGRVHVVYGGGSAGSQTITQDDSFIFGGPERGDRFGFSMASVDYDEDGCTDLVIGTPYEGSGSLTASGWVDVVFGSPTGLGSNGGLNLRQGSGGMPGGQESGDRFGFSLAAGVTTGGDPFIVIGVPGEDIGSSGDRVDAGTFHYVRGSQMLMVHQDTSGVFGVGESGDQYGFAVAASSRHIAVGGPGEAIGDLGYAGTVGVFSHNVAAGTIAGWDQAQPGDTGLAEANDWCGRSLAMVDYIPPGGSAGDARSVLATGCPGESTGDVLGAGRIMSMSAGSDLSELYSIHRETPGVEGEANRADYFASSIRVVNRAPGTAATWDSLLIAAGVPGDDVDEGNEGSVHILSAIGAPGDHDVIVVDAGMVDAGWQPTVDAALGQYLGGSQSHLYIADPHGATPAVYAVPWQNLTDGASDPVRVYQPGSDGLPTSGVGTFGAAVV